MWMLNAVFIDVCINSLAKLLINARAKSIAEVESMGKKPEDSNDR